MVEYQQTEEEIRAQKQNYLVENVVNQGYDTEKFGTFMNYKKGKLLELTLINSLQRMALMLTIGPWMRSLGLWMNSSNTITHCLILPNNNTITKSQCIRKRKKQMMKDSGSIFLTISKQMKNGTCHRSKSDREHQRLSSLRQLSITAK